MQNTMELPKSGTSLDLKLPVGSQGFGNSKSSGSLLCPKDALTDEFGWAVQVILACLAFMCLIIKRFCEPRRERRSWLIWFYDTSKQGMGAMVIHFANIFLASFFQGDPCTWYVVSFLLDSSVGLLVIYIGIRVTLKIAEQKNIPELLFGEYGTPPLVKAWLAQCGMYVAIMVVEKVLITLLIQLQFWDHVRDFILSPISDPKVAIAIVLLVIPFFMNVIMFWVTDNFLMRRHHGKNSKLSRKLRYQRIRGDEHDSALILSNTEADILLSGEDDVIDIEAAMHSDLANGGNSAVRRPVNSTGSLDHA